MMDLTEIDMLGRRDIDRKNPWTAECRGEQYTNNAIHFINAMKQNDLLIPEDMMMSISYEILGAKKKKALNIIMTHYNQGEHVMPLFIIIQGIAGTGKSYLIQAIRQALYDASTPQRYPLLLLAPTGIAAFNIGASTIHSTLRIPLTNFSDL